ncbi:hydroxyacid dehydrogenase [Patescibacteria group bacterium]|nr:hydroxyacid dehydrogenase [Patescibacteria group bacterium]
MKVLVADKIDETVLSSYKNQSIVFDYRPEISPSELLTDIGQYDGLLVRSRTKVSQEVIDSGKNLLIIGRVGSGLDNIDTVTAKKQKIKVVNAPDGNTDAVVELTVALMLSLLRNLGQAYTSMSKGLWLKKELRGKELGGKTIGIVGYGHIGRKVARLAKAFGCQVYFYSRTKRNCSLKKLFKNSDLISLHLPLTEATKNLVDRKLLGLMKPSSYLVNVGRGKTVSEKDLYQFLSAKKIAGAAMDVYWEEPLPPDSPWRKLDNVILTPHIGASTKEALTRATTIVVKTVIEFLKSK